MSTIEEPSDIEPENEGNIGPTVLNEESDTTPAFLQGIAVDAVTSGSATGTAQPVEVRFDESGLYIRYYEYYVPRAIRDQPPIFVTNYKEIPEEVEQKEVTVSFNKAYDRIIGSISATISLIEPMFKETNGKAQEWNRWSMIAAISGFIIIVI